MACNSCGCNTNPCCCPPNSGIPYQIPGPKGAQGIPGPQGNPGPTGPTGPIAPGGPTVFGQAYKTDLQIMNTGDPVIWTNVQNANGVSIANAPTNTQLQVSEDGLYQITFKILLTSESSPP